MERRATEWRYGSEHSSSEFMEFLLSFVVAGLDNNYGVDKDYDYAADADE